ncbi:MAG: hypothetical protein NVSMB51_09240 [Solirubrobacteraceae bacterium]
MLALATLLPASLWLAMAGAGSAQRLGNLELLPVARTTHGAIVRLFTSRRVVALSFDDGPDRRFTAAVLRILAAHRAHASFFAVGRSALAHRTLIAAELRGGNEVENHTFDHADLRRLRSAAARDEVARGRRALLAAGAPDPRLFRAPYGNFDAAAAREARHLHEVMVAWSVTVERALNGRSVRHALDWLLRRVRPGTIILAHDGRLDRERTLLALPGLLDALARRGYRVVTISELLRVGGAETRTVLRRLDGSL